MARGLKYDDWKIGEIVETTARTVTEADIVNFAGLSGDYNAIHINEEFAKTTNFGGRIAHGALVFAISTGLINASGVIEGCNVIFLDADLKWPSFTKAGDTIKVQLIATEKRPTKNPARGIVNVDCKVINQKDTVVMDAKFVWMLDV